MDRIYFDYNATTPLKPKVYEGMLPYLKEAFGNPSSVHWAGRKAKEATMVAREQIAAFFHCDPEEIIFTSGGTEANNFALKGVYERLKHRGRHIITSKVEHVSILDCCDYLKKIGAEVSYLSVDSQGLIDLGELEELIRPDTILVSIQAANNETGVLMPIPKISHVVKEHGLLLHVDAVQIAGKLPFFLNEMPVDMISISGHKIYGPKGVGALILKRGLKLEALIHGGNQERKRRGGTENVAAIVGFGLASESAMNESVGEASRLSLLRDQLEKGIIDRIPNCCVNGKRALRVPNTVNISFEEISGESLLLNLDLEGIAASLGSACSSGSLQPSHVLLAMGRSEENAQSSIRLSLGYQTTQAEIERVLEILPGLISDLRRSEKVLQ